MLPTELIGYIHDFTVGSNHHWRSQNQQVIETVLGLCDDPTRFYCYCCGEYGGYIFKEDEFYCGSCVEPDVFYT